VWALAPHKAVPPDVMLSPNSNDRTKLLVTRRTYAGGLTGPGTASACRGFSLSGVRYRPIPQYPILSAAPPPMGNRKGMPTAIPQMDRNLLVEVYKSGQAPGSRGANE